jgi:enamine deaminase RidA (YjgF/YER057c/UK114 family)
MTADVRRVQSGSPWEDSIGFARAVAAGDRVLVAGTTSFKDSVLYGEGDPYEQARVAFGSALEAIGRFGLGPGSVIRTRMYLTHTRDVDEAGRAHREIFGSVRPAATMVVVSGFVDPRILVEIELEAYLGAGTSGPTETGSQEAGREAPQEAGSAVGEPASREESRSRRESAPQEGAVPDGEPASQEPSAAVPAGVSA